ncbi:alpha/beta hydrolase [Xylanimonas allomyrinae]|uniref:Alpha/beta hydrolase n=2 Tax=Xylanimonas allomyrinae TaxID=2509459 RepID=A0A4P6EQE2_9MICO|nr:alpha/beta hydrolase [Xylanimonas allomyrinae]
MGGLQEVWDYIDDKRRRSTTLAAIACQLPPVPFILWGHSLGSVIAFELAAHLPARAAPALLVTSGSPLNLRKVRANPLSGVRGWSILSRAFPWINVYDGFDHIAKYGGLSEAGYGPITDIQVRNGGRFHSGNRYLGHDDVWREMDRQLRR